MLDSSVKAKKKYLLQVFLEECKYEQQKKVENLIDDNLEKGESDSNSSDETESCIDNDEAVE